MALIYLEKKESKCIEEIERDRDKEGESGGEGDRISKKISNKET